MPNCRVVVALLLLSTAAVPAGAQDYTIPRSRTIYIERMQNDLDGYIRAEFIKQRVPLTVVLSGDQSDLVLVGSSSADENRPWHEGLLTPMKDHATGAIMVVDKKSNTMLWA